ncbi:MAG: hypothetical protein M3N04_08675 [Actinomycetota bacterium]|nr:hypothetical protein [Actinomycetota bacterium]
MAVLLDKALLDRFEAALRGAGAVIVDHLAPGVDDARIDALLAPHRIELPEEARVWWRWHNGVLPGTPRTYEEITPGRDLRSLETVVYQYEQSWELMLDGGVVKMLEPFNEKPVIFLDCKVPRDAPIPIHSLSDWTENLRLVLPSFGELIATWIGYIDRGVFRTNPDGTWAWNPDILPRDVVELGVY